MYCNDWHCTLHLGLVDMIKSIVVFECNEVLIPALCTLRSFSSSQLFSSSPFLFIWWHSHLQCFALKSPTMIIFLDIDFNDESAAIGNGSVGGE